MVPPTPADAAFRPRLRSFIGVSASLALQCVEDDLTPVRRAGSEPPDSTRASGDGTGDERRAMPLFRLHRYAAGSDREYAGFMTAAPLRPRCGLGRIAMPSGKLVTDLARDNRHLYSHTTTRAASAPPTAIARRTVPGSYRAARSHPPGHRLASAQPKPPKNRTTAGRLTGIVGKRRAAPAANGPQVTRQRACSPAFARPSCP